MPIILLQRYGSWHWDLQVWHIAEMIFPWFVLWDVFIIIVKLNMILRNNCDSRDAPSSLLFVLFFVKLRLIFLRYYCLRSIFFAWERSSHNFFIEKRIWRFRNLWRLHPILYLQLLGRVLHIVLRSGGTLESSIWILHVHIFLLLHWPQILVWEICLILHGGQWGALLMRR